MDKKTELHQKIQRIKTVQKEYRKIAENRVNEELKAEKHFWDEENKKLNEKKKILADITNWKNKFIKEYSDIFDIDEDLVIFGWREATIPQVKDQACWSRLKLTKNGKLIYSSGYKYMPHKDIELNQNTIKNFIYSYLKELHHFVMSGKIYEQLIDSLKEEDNVWIEKDGTTHLVSVKDKTLSKISVN